MSVFGINGQAKKKFLPPAGSGSQFLGHMTFTRPLFCDVIEKTLDPKYGASDNSHQVACKYSLERKSIVDTK